MAGAPVFLERVVIVLLVELAEGRAKSFILVLTKSVPIESLPVLLASWDIANPPLFDGFA